MTDRLRALPSVDRLATAVARAELAERRDELLAGAEDEVDLLARARQRLKPSLRRVLNATGVIVHTNLGRAPLAPAAREAVNRAARGYVNLELDLADGERTSRHEHVERLLRELTGRQAATLTTNCAAAVLLAVSALAGTDREVIVSRAGIHRDRRRLPHARRRRTDGSQARRGRDDESHPSIGLRGRDRPRHEHDPACTPIELPRAGVRPGRRWEGSTPSPLRSGSVQYDTFHLDMTRRLDLERAGEPASS